MSPFARRSGSQPLVYGHRGTRRGAPENTLAAMGRAIAQGADGIELDVRLCGSGEVVVLHDQDLARVAGVRLTAARTSLSALRAHDLGEGERVPLLDEALELVLGAGLLLNVELKADVPDPDALARGVLACLAARTPDEQARVVLSSFSAPLCRTLATASGIPVAWLLERPPRALPAGIRAVHPSHAYLSERTLFAYAAAGLIVNVWTVNDPARALALARQGVDGIITDDVPRVRAALAAM